MTAERLREDLVVLVADTNMRFGIEGLLERPLALGIAPLEARVFVHPERDPGCYHHAHELLRPLSVDHRYALVLFDREGCGQEAKSRGAIEEEVESRLAKAGWADRAAVIVIDPELESWVWSDSPEVDSVLGWAGREVALRDWLRERGFEFADSGKPLRPKEAMQSAMRHVRKSRSSAIYHRLSSVVSLKRCSDEAFLKLRERLGTWFGVQPGDP